MEPTKTIDKEYLAWIAELSNRYRQSQIKAAVMVNSEMLRFYWSVGKDIAERQYDNRYGSHFYENLSRDLSLALNKKKGFSPTSLKYTKYFYSLYAPLFANLQQGAEKLDVQNRQQLSDDFSVENRPQHVDVFKNVNRPQVVDELRSKLPTEEEIEQGLNSNVSIKK